MLLAAAAVAVVGLGISFAPLELQHTRFTGEMPDFSKCVGLQVLTLDLNQLTGTQGHIGAHICNFLPFQRSGSITDFSKCTALEFLDLSQNQFTGK
jgi:hypothetical protein